MRPEPRPPIDQVGKTLDIRNICAQTHFFDGFALACSRDRHRGPGGRRLPAAFCARPPLPVTPVLPSTPCSTACAHSTAPATPAPPVVRTRTCSPTEGATRHRVIVRLVVFLGYPFAQCRFDRSVERQIEGFEPAQGDPHPRSRCTSPHRQDQRLSPAHLLQQRHLTFVRHPANLDGAPPCSHLQPLMQDL